MNAWWGSTIAAKLWELIVGKVLSGGEAKKGKGVDSEMMLRRLNGMGARIVMMITQMRFQHAIYKTIYQTKVATLSQQQARAVVKHFKERLAITVERDGSGRNLTMVKAELSAKWPKNTPYVVVCL